MRTSLKRYLLFAFERLCLLLGIVWTAKVAFLDFPQATGQLIVEPKHHGLFETLFVTPSIVVMLCDVALVIGMFRINWVLRNRRQKQARQDAGL